MLTVKSPPVVELGNMAHRQCFTYDGWYYQICKPLHSPNVDLQVSEDMVTVYKFDEAEICALRGDTVVTPVKLEIGEPNAED